MGAAPRDYDAASCSVTSRRMRRVPSAEPGTLPSALRRGRRLVQRVGGLAPRRAAELRETGAPKRLVTDVNGLSDAATVVLQPNTVELDFETAPAGLQASVGGSVSVAPFAATMIASSAQTVSAQSPEVSGGTT
jgi:hypothetical protein